MFQILQANSNTFSLLVLGVIYATEPFSILVPLPTQCSLFTVPKEIRKKYGFLIFPREGGNKGTLH